MAVSHHIQWTTASSEWARIDVQDNGNHRQFRQPMLLRFATDMFMDDFMKIMAFAPLRLGDWKLTRETWRQPAPILPAPQPIPELPAFLGVTPDIPQAPYDEEPDDIPLKMFQPAHRRYYIVAASLVCRMPGLPDRALRFSTERTTFVLRRLFRPADYELPENTTYEPDIDDPTTYEEYAFVNNQWVPAVQDEYGEELKLDGEEQYPLSPVGYQEPGEYPRRLLVGLVPVGQREKLINAQRGTTPPSADTIEDTMGTSIPLDAREAYFREQVLAPWSELLGQAERAGTDLGKLLSPNKLTDLDASVINTEIAPDLKTSFEAMWRQIQTGSWYILLDFADYLKRYLPVVWDHIVSTPNRRSLLDDEQILFDALSDTHYKYTSNVVTLPTYTSPTYTPTSWVNAVEPLLLGLFTADDPDDTDPSLAEVLAQIDADAVRGVLEKTVNPAEDPPDAWPKFLLTGDDPTDLYNGDLPAYVALAALIRAALLEQDDTDRTDIAPVRVPEMPLAAETARAALTQPGRTDDPSWFVIRCVFERPNCVPYQMPVLSDVTVPFQLAAFFDPDAPARPIRIPMPEDTSPAGLRKFAKNTAFQLSDQLCGQVNELRRKLTFVDLVLSVLPWPFHQDLPSASANPKPCSESVDQNMLGMICSLSIPIVTICAFIILIVFVLLLNVIFKWVPYLIACFPLPKLDGGGD